MELSLNAVGLAAILWGFAAMLFVYGITAPFTQTEGRTDSIEENAWAIDYERDLAAAQERDALFEKVIRPIIRNFIPQSPFAARVQGTKRDKVIALLISSGNPWHLSPEEYSASLWLGGAFGAIAGLFAGFILGINPIVLAFLIGAMGAFFPRWHYRRQRSLRVDEANRSLPEGIDLLRIVMVSGQKFQSAMVEVSQRLPEGIIRNEFGRVADDLRSGRTLDRTMTDFAMRIPAESVESFSRAIIQGERLGAEITDTLEHQSESIRRSYEARIDKAIAQLETTIFLPILIGLVPAIFIIVAAPALVSILNFL